MVKCVHGSLCWLVICKGWKKVFSTRVYWMCAICCACLCLKNYTHWNVFFYLQNYSFVVVAVVHNLNCLNFIFVHCFLGSSFFFFFDSFAVSFAVVFFSFFIFIFTFVFFWWNFNSMGSPHLTWPHFISSVPLPFVLYESSNYSQK